MSVLRSSIKLAVAWGGMVLTPLGICAPVAYWSLDGNTVPERLGESLGQSSLNASETNGSSSWSTRSGFGNVLANGTANQYLTVPHENLIDPGMGDFSLSIWTYRTSDSSTSKGILDFLSSSAGSGYQLFYQSDNSIRIRIDDTNGNSKIVDTLGSHYTPNNWQNIIVTVDRTAHKVRIYTNGTEATVVGGVDISNITGSIIPDQNLFIGSFNTSDAAHGRIDDVGLFNHVLTAAEISSIQANGGTPLSQVFPAVQVADVTISPASGVIKASDVITITPTDVSDAIYYTLDGSDPDENSTLYTGAITLPASGELKAVAYKDGNAGQISAAHFLLIPATPPNIILIVADDVGFGDLSCNGAPTIATPNLDQLAASGARFTQFTTCGPGDLANQHSLLTGRVARRSGLPDSLNPGDVNGLDSREWTLAEALRKTGYETAFVGVWHLGDTAGSIATDQGFQLFYGLPYRTGGSPEPPLLENTTTIDSQYVPTTLLSQLTNRAKSFISAQTSDPFFLVFQPPSVSALGTSLLGSHGNRVEALDSAVGELRTALDVAGHTANTLIIFLSDGGPDLSAASAPLGSTGIFRDGKSTTWEGGVRVPAISSWPGVVPAASDNYSVMWLPDLFSSITQITGAYTPDDHVYDGTARAEVLLAGRRMPDADTKLYLHRYVGGSYQLQAARQGPWKCHLTYNNSDPQNNISATAPLLYHLENDPTEHVNRSSSHSSILADLQQSIAAYQATFAAPAPQLPDAKEPFVGDPQLVVSPEVGANGQFSAQFTRPLDSLNDHYTVQYSYNLNQWVTLPITDYITSIVPQSGNTETLNLTLNLTAPEFSPRPLFFRLKATRP